MSNSSTQPIKHQTAVLRMILRTRSPPLKSLQKICNTTKNHTQFKGDLHMNEWHAHGFHIDTIYDDGTAARIQKNEEKFQNCTNRPRKHQTVNKELIRKIRCLFKKSQINSNNEILEDFIKINTAKLVTPYGVEYFEDFILLLRMEDFGEVKSILLTRFRIDKGTSPEFWNFAKYDEADETEVIVTSSELIEEILADIAPLIHYLYQ